MAEREPSGGPRRPADAAANRLRHAIDSGATGDKVRLFDPAVVPLGTDEEAAGTPPDPVAVAAAADYEMSRPRSRGPADTSLPDRGAPLATIAGLLLAILLVILVTAFVFMTR